MKRIIPFLLGIPLIICTGCAPSEPVDVVRPMIVADESAQESVQPGDFFFSTLEFDSEKGYIYPDTFGGMYVDGNDLVFLVASENFSDYQYLKDAYPNDVVFKRVEYSKNYLQGLIDEYLSTYDKNTETVYMAYVDVKSNRAVIKVDEQTLSHKVNDENSPLVFVSGSSLSAL